MILESNKIKRFTDNMKTAFNDVARVNHSDFEYFVAFFKKDNELYSMVFSTSLYIVVSTTYEIYASFMDILFDRSEYEYLGYIKTDKKLFSKVTKTKNLTDKDVDGLFSDFYDKSKLQVTEIKYINDSLHFTINATKTKKVKLLKKSFIRDFFKNNSNESITHFIELFTKRDIVFGKDKTIEIFNTLKDYDNSKGVYRTDNGVNFYSMFIPAKPKNLLYNYILKRHIVKVYIAKIMTKTVSFVMYSYLNTEENNDG